MALFLYWNVCIFYVRGKSKSRTNKWLYLAYAFFTVDISFLLALFYGYFSRYTQVSDGCPADILCAFNAVMDSPSIWCVFFGIQVLFLPVLFYLMLKKYDVKAGNEVEKVSKNTKYKLLLITGVIWTLLFLMLPMFFGVSLKMVTTSFFGL